MRAENVMTSGTATVRSDAPLGEAIALMVGRRVSGLPVLDGDGRLVGILTEGDLLRRVETNTELPHRAKWLDILRGPGDSAGRYVRTHSRRVEDLMTRNVATVRQDASLEDVVTLMEKRHVKRVPVVKGDRVVGIVSRADLVRTLGRLLEQPAGEGADDAEIGDRLQSNLRDESWFAARNVSITVKAGVVKLEGVVTDERAHEALRVATQNLAGVTAIDDQLIWMDPRLAIPII